MPTDSESVSIRLPSTSRAQLDDLMARWGVQPAEAIRRAIWLAWREETQGDAPQPTPPPQTAASSR